MLTNKSIFYVFFLSHKIRRRLMKKSVFILAIFLIIYLPSASQESADFIKLQKVAVSKVPDTLIVPDLFSITFDSKGNVFAFAGLQNGKECFIVKFDKNLNYILRFGRDGRGPGEFKTTYSSPEDRLSVDKSNGDVYVTDYNPGKIVVFDNNGKHKEDIPYQRDFIKQLGYMSKVKVVGPGLFMARRRIRSFPVDAVIFSLRPPKIILSYPLDTLRIDVRVGSTMVTGPTETCYGDNHFMETDSKHIVFGNSQKYKFHVYDIQGNKILEIEDPEKIMGSFKSKELKIIGEKWARIEKNSPVLFNKLMKQMKTRKNVIAAIKIDGKQIYVFPVRDDVTVNNKFPVEVYNLEGKILKRGFFKKIPDKIWKNFAFYKEYDDEYNPLIIKYKIMDFK